MSYTGDFTNDIFISYAHIDNQPLTEQQKGWIDELHRVLEIRLQQLLGDKPKIWRDRKLQGNDIFDDEIVQQFPGVAILVSVLSPRYVKSEWCRKEVQEFMKAAQQKLGLTVGNKSRIFKIVKTLVPLEQHPPELQKMLGYEFFQLDKDTGRPIEFQLDYGPEAVRNQFWAKLDDLAWDIRQLLETLKAKNGKPAVAQPKRDKAIYLAEASFDMRDERENLKRELQHLGYTIYPDQALPLFAHEFRIAVLSYLEKSAISIHLVGENYGVIPDGETHSIVQLQNEIAAEMSDKLPFTRLIWMPVGLQTRDERQQHFVDFLQHDASAQKGAELLQTALEELKTVAIDKLTVKEKPAAAAPAPGTDLTRIYLICEPTDFEATAALEKLLFDQGYEVLLPTTGDDEAAVREDHKENLLLCDAAIVYYGRAGDSWVRAKMRDFVKAPGWGRQKPFLAKMVYIDAPDSPQKQRFRTLDALVVRNEGEVSPQVLAPFFEALAAAKGGPA